MFVCAEPQRAVTIICAIAVGKEERVIVKSGVQAMDSSGGLIDVCDFDSIVEFHSSNHLGQIIESS